VCLARLTARRDFTLRFAHIQSGVVPPRSMVMQRAAFVERGVRTRRSDAADFGAAGRAFDGIISA